MVKRGLQNDSVMQRSSSDSSVFIDFLIQFENQDAQDCLNRNWDNAENDISETLQNKGNLSAEQKKTLNWFFLESVLSLFWSAAELKHEKGICQLKQTAQKEILKGAATVLPQNV